MLAAYHYYYLPVLCAESVEVGAKYGSHLIRQAGVGGLRLQSTFHFIILILEFRLKIE